MSKLEPCPFCGGEAELYGVPHIPSGWDYIPRCKTTSCCGRQAKKYSSREIAISAWNRRAGGWIPVSERLPDTSTLVLVYDHEVALPGWYGIDRAEQDDGGATPHWHLYGMALFGRGNHLKQVTHWMPLPAAPETERSDG